MRTDETLYLDLLAGDMSAFDALYKRYEGPLFGYVLRRLGDHGEAEDVFHETFLAVLRERDHGRHLTSFRGWVFQVARNLCHNRLRSRERGARALATEARAAPLVDDGEALLSARPLSAALERAAARLPEPLAELYLLRVSGLSYHEIADALGVPLGTVKSRMHALVTQLRREMQT